MLSSNHHLKPMYLNLYMYHHMYLDLHVYLYMYMHMAAPALGPIKNRNSGPLLAEAI